MYIAASVGEGGRNNESDVRVIQHLLSARGRWMSPILDVPRTGKIDDKLIAGIKRFQKEVLRFRTADGRVDAPGKTLNGLESDLALSASVGYSGVNHESDIYIVQTLLGLHGYLNHICPIPGKYSMDLEVAINDFQKDVVKLSHPDGRVDPGGRSYKTLIGVKSGGGSGGGRQPSKVKFKQFTPSTGCYSYATEREQWATEKTVASLLKAAKKFYEQEGVLIGIGHLSLSGGQKFPPHKSHRTGRDADIRPVRSDGAKSPVQVDNDNYSHERTAALVSILRDDTNLRQILFNDSKIYKKHSNVKYYQGHHNHLHVSFKQ
ncbi:MAG: hypothetical protein AAFU85_03600 [Planctomycetota bacterium]